MSKLNILTSFCFLATFLHSYHRECFDIQSACLLCLITSVSYHGTCHAFNSNCVLNAIRYIDMVVCQSCVAYFTYQSIFSCYHWLCIGFVTSLMCTFCIYYVFRLSSHPQYGVIWHSILHLIANAGVSFLIEAQFRMT